MPIYKAQSTFPGEVQDATGGWDVVYGVKYSTINTDFAQRQPWKRLEYLGQPGGFSVTIPGATLEGTISDIKIVAGGPPNHVRFLVSIIDGKLTGPVPSAGTKSIAVTIDSKLAFSIGAEPGLLHLSVTEKIEAGEIAVTFSPAYPVAQSAIAASRAATCIEALFSDTGAAKAIISDSLATVYTHDYAHSVNLPWLVPKTVAYATAALPAISSTEGVLAVLGCVDSDPGALTAAISPNAIPTNADINAFTIINPKVLAQGTFYKALNGGLGQASLAEFVFDKTAQVVWNAKDVSAFYRINAETGWSEILTTDQLANSVGRTYPLIIPRKALRCAFQDNAVKVELLGAQVDLGHGSQLFLSIEQEIELVVQDDGSIDCVPVGAPTMTHHLSMGPEASESELGAFAISLGVTIAVELVTHAVDRLNIGATALSSKLVNLYAMDCLAAMAQGEQTRTSVTVDIGAGRQLIVRKPAWRRQPTALQKEYRVGINFREKLVPLPRALQNPPAAEPIPPRIGGAQRREIELPNNINRNLGRELPEQDEINLGPAQAARAEEELSLIRGQRENVARLDAPQRDYDVKLELRRKNIGQFLFDIRRSLPRDFRYRDFRELILEKVGERDRANTNAMLDVVHITPRANVRGRNPPNVGNLEISDAAICQVYENAAKFLEARRKEGGIADADYVRILENSPTLINLENQPRLVRQGGYMELFGPRHGQLGEYISLEGQNKSFFGQPREAPIAFGLRQNLQREIESDHPGAALSTIKLIIERQPLPAWAAVVTFGVYVGGLVFGLFAPTIWAKLFQSGETNASKTNKAMADVLGTNDPKLTDQEKAKLAATRLFGAVRFPFMTQFDPSAPRPDVVLKSAAVHGGLILGVLIVTNI